MAGMAVTSYGANSLPTGKELKAVSVLALMRYRSAVHRELRRVRRHKSKGRRRCLQAQLIADAILEAMLREQLALVKEVIVAGDGH